MSIALLYCEGGEKSPDLQVLVQLLSGTNCLVRPSGGKYGFGERLKIRRELDTPKCAGLRDRDFDADDSVPVCAPREWRADKGRLWLGWSWERREIENYLLDPVVVQVALQLPLDVPLYWQRLHEAALSITAYTAARYALSLSRVRFAPLPSGWGRGRGCEDHKFPDDRDADQCRSAIVQVVEGHECCQQISAAAVLERFESILPTCEPGGARFAHFLTFFAGKDLLYALEPALQNDFGFKSALAFREQILKGMRRAAEVWVWLPEWEALRNLILG